MHNILLTGASGKLGTAIQRAGIFKNLLTPNLEALDIINLQSVENFFQHNTFDTIIHCAAQARMALAHTDPIATIKTNIVGTANLVMATIKHAPSARFIHISTDAVYTCDTGNYSEESPTIPYNKYGWSKLGAECSVNLLQNFCIIRTSFFDQKNIPFEDAAVDCFSSKLELTEFIEALRFIIQSDFIGTINVAGERKSDYERYKTHKSTLKKTTYEAIQKGLPFAFYQDASLDITQWKKIKKDNEKPTFAQPKTINHRPSL